MLTALELENFKGISGRQRLELARITLLFGANNAGKSTILQALLYLHELLAHGGADVDRTALGGQVVELGGFARLVHRHDRSRPIVIRAEFTTTGSLERFGRLDDELAFPDLDDATDSAWIELTVRERETPNFRGPIVDRVIVGVGSDREPLVWVEAGHTLREGEWLNARVNMGHSALGELAADVASRWQDVAIPEEALHRALEEEGGGYGAGSGAGAGLGDGSGFGDGRPLPVFAISRSRMSALPPLSEPIRVLPPDDDAGPDAGQSLVEIRMFLEMVLLGTTSQLAAVIESMLYVGPLRTVPPRGFLYERRGRLMSWADGLAAWDLLLADRTTLVERTNAWLARLGAGCEIIVQELYKGGASAEAIAEGHVDETVRRLLLSTGNSSLVLPSEVGAGISQVIPIIVAAIAPTAAKLVAIEQPEIHVHPALQVGLGDLLIEESKRRSFLIETHSEHLLLRIMRRLRETSEGCLPVNGVPISPDDVRVLLFEVDGERRIVREMPLNERGELVKAWPGGFFEEGLREVF